MKKTGIAFGIAASLLILVSASVWEGAASASLGGDLPDNGYYAATNSFPRNTVVDVTNLENGRTIRVIVAGGLETPGLLVVLSRDAASAVGLQPRSIGRVRMNQPADPVAFSRFTEGLGSSGDPDHDPAALAAAEGINPDLLEEERLLEEGSPENGEIAALPVETGTPPEESAALPEETGSPEIAAALSDETGALAGETVTVPEEIAALPEETSTPPEESAALPEETGALEIAAGDTSGDGVVPEPGPELVWTPPEGDDYEYALEPAEPRAPEGPAPAIDPANVLGAARPSPQAEREYIIDPSLIIPPVRQAQPPQVPAPPQQTALQPQPDTSQPPAAPLPQAGGTFSVPVIASLERGRYYVQVAALSKAESVEMEINKIGRSLPLAVQSAGSPEKPVYRILIGPVNLGESGALLQRFKAAYKDAFVRLGS
ncbi:MAG: SPOR domain-containing protein [Treponema sp.]|jgi:hypothetical protein|nr:SPOR domain-containing protein [Treponema sp.]